MTRTRAAVFALLVSASACRDTAPGLPAVTFLSPEDAFHTGSRFSPDGSRVAYWAPGADGYDLIIARADLSGARTVSSHNAQTWAVAWSPDGGQLAYASSATNVADIYIVGADSGDARQLTSAPGYEVPNAWSADGHRISYNATREGDGVRGMILDLRTGESSMLPNREAPVARWSPDGKRMGLAGFGAVSTLWVADSAGDGAVQLTTEGREFTASWSPDGTEIAYTSRRTGTGDIWVIPASGGEPRQLTHDIRDDTDPRWSPDGRWIAFISNRGRQTDVWVVPAAGGPEIRITDDAAEENNLQWVGSRLSYHTGSTGNSIWAVSPAGGAERRLTADSIETGEINPSPDGTEVAYEIIRGGGVSELRVMPIAGGPSRTLVTGSSINTQPSWSPDGKSILFLSNRSGNVDVWVVAASGGEPRQLTDFTTPELNPQWSPDGSAVYFTSRWEAAPFSDLWQVPAAGGAPVRMTRTGTINGLAVSRVSPDILVQDAGGKEGRTILARVHPDGRLEPLWDQSNVTGVSWFSFTPKGDSFAVNAELPDGANGSYLISTRTGQGRQVLDRGDQVGDFSSNGRWLGYWGGNNASLELGVIDMRDGSHRLLTRTPESETSYWWTADDTLLFTRQWTKRRIAIVDLGKLEVPTAP